MVITLGKPPLALLPSIVNMVQSNHPGIKELGQDIYKFYIDQRQSQEMSEERDSYVNLIRKYLTSEGLIKQIKSQGIRINGLTVFGSFPTHCASKDSDLDLCVCATYEGKNKPLPVTVLQAIFRDLQHNLESRKFFGKENKIHDISFVQTARVPIIRFKINNVPVDLSATFDSSPPRTSLAAKYINAYCQLDDRFKVLVTFLKAWMKSEGNAEDHLRDFPNSYSLILLLIHVLQWYDILPNLHQTHSEIFNHRNFKSWGLAEIRHEFKFPLDENTIAMHRKRSTKDLSIVQLLYLFACQYSEESILLYYRFNMKTGIIEGRSKNSREYPITIVDVYDSRNPARSARSTLDFVGALSELRRLFLLPQTGMFANLMKVTEEKTYFRQIPSIPLFQAQDFPPLMNYEPKMPQPRPQLKQHHNTPQIRQRQVEQGRGNCHPHQMNYGMQTHSHAQPLMRVSVPKIQNIAFGQYPYQYLNSQYHHVLNENVYRMDLGYNPV